MPYTPKGSHQGKKEETILAEDILATRPAFGFLHSNIPKKKFFQATTCTALHHRQGASRRSHVTICDCGEPHAIVLGGETGLQRGYDGAWIRAAAWIRWGMDQGCSVDTMGHGSGL